MKPHIVRLLGDNAPTSTLYYGRDVREVLRELPDQSVQMIATSPPYWGLRDYGTEPVKWADGSECSLGLEPTPEAYAEHLVEIIREARRVLADDGVLWLNLGDSFVSHKPRGDAQHTHSAHINNQLPTFQAAQKATDLRGKHSILKDKDLVGIPWRVAFALQADGWYLRSDIIWSKFNPMPESVTDRPIKAHEYIFLLTKSPRYFYDHEAVKEEAAGGHQGAAATFKRTGSKREQCIPGQGYGTHRPERDEVAYNGETRNRRSVWEISTKPYRGAHFATWPEALVEPMIKAGCPKDRRVIVLDIFSGSATTGVVANRLGHDYIGIDLNADYLPLAERRLRGITETASKDEEDEQPEDMTIAGMFGVEKE